ncbi:hypothetical protein N9F57_03900 [Gammaproteobacteria bacterium]|nr:hypothetical protein [Gammaproteobacteria bacterium]
MNGPENISKYLRVPIPDRPVLGILRISPPKARELNLNPDQIIRGIVAEDGKSIEFLLGNIKQEIRSNLEQWKGKAVEFKVNIDKNGSGPSGGTAIVSPEASLYQSLNPRHYLLHPKSLITLLSNPNYSQLEFLNKIQFGSLIDWLKSFYPSFSATALLSSLIYSAKKIDASEIKKQLKNNGFTFASKEIVVPENNSLVTIKHAISILLENLGEKINSSDSNLKADDFNGLIDYLNANEIEYILKQEQRELGVRFILLFSDFPITEIYIEGENTNPKIKGAYKYSVEIKLIFNKGNDIWSRIELIEDRTLAIDFLISDSQTTRLANANKQHLFELFQSVGIELVRCDVREGQHVEKNRKEILKEKGNLELSA